MSPFIPSACVGHTNDFNTDGFPYTDAMWEAEVHFCNCFDYNELKLHRIRAPDCGVAHRLRCKVTGSHPVRISELPSGGGEDSWG